MPEDSSLKIFVWFTKFGVLAGSSLHIVLIRVFAIFWVIEDQYFGCFVAEIEFAEF